MTKNQILTTHFYSQNFQSKRLVKDNYAWSSAFWIAKKSSLNTFSTFQKYSDKQFPKKDLLETPKDPAPNRTKNILENSAAFKKRESLLF